MQYEDRDAGLAQCLDQFTRGRRTHPLRSRNGNVEAVGDTGLADEGVEALLLDQQDKPIAPGWADTPALTANQLVEPGNRVATIRYSYVMPRFDIRANGQSPQ